MKTISIIALLYLSQIHASPFEVTDNYIQGYEDGITNLKKEASEYHAHEGSYETEYKAAEPITDPQEYDFIIVGGGTSGAVLASRLSEVPEYKVLLLEAGDLETKITKIPAMAETLKSSKHSWGYLTEPQTNCCLGSENKQCQIQAGKIMGGTSAVNDLVYTRGNARDYDSWADEGNDGWCYDDVLPYFKKSENAHLHNFDRKYHNQGGLLNVENPKHLSNLSENFVEAGKELGYKPVDYNGKEQIGFSLVQLNTKEGERYSTSEAYLKHFLNRKNLVVRPNSQVIEILISPHTKEAQGVKYVSGEHVKIAKASKEVILAAGAINSAQILMLSGVGPKETLEKHKIECVHDSPVGKTLKDHPTFIGLSYFYKDDSDDDSEHDLIHYLKYGKGPLTVTGTEGLIFAKTEAAKDTVSTYPDVYMSFIPRPKVSGHDAHFDIQVSAAHPKSSGSVELKSKDPLNWPKINLNHFSDEDGHDLVTVLKGIRLAQKICDTEAFKKVGATLNEHAVEACAEHKFNSDDYWKCAIKHMSVSAGHYTGTCAMGKEAVVDNKLRVHGVHKLRVADSGIIPVSITGHTQAATVMVGEKAADLIKHDWH